MRSLQQGFTLLELLVVIAIAAVLTGLAVPSFRAAIQSAESRDAATGFYAALNRARSEAIARNTEVSLCARNVADPAVPACATGSGSDAAWRNGWIIYATNTPAEPLLIHEPIADGLMLGVTTSPLAFDANGRVAASVSFDLCRGMPDTKGRNIRATRSGRVVLEPKTC